MKRREYEAHERYMRSHMTDSAHDPQHIYRVLYIALDIAGHEPQVDMDVLITACLLHDIGRNAQFQNAGKDHAEVGAALAYDYLVKGGYAPSFSARVRDAILTHRYRSETPPQAVEAKILFDADKIDVTGAMGIARTLLYQGIVGGPLYRLHPDGTVSDGKGDEAPSFFREYHFKLKNIYDRFYTARAGEIAAQRKKTTQAFYQALLQEVAPTYQQGEQRLDHILK